MSERPGRTAAEWTTFAVSCGVLLVLIASIVAQALHEDRAASPVARITTPARDVDGHHLVEVEVTNEGDVTAADVQVTASLVIDGETTDADQVIAFLAGGDAETVVFVFADAPSDGELTVAVSGFSAP